MYNKYNSIVYRVSLKILNSQHDAEDAAHNMWLKVIRNFKKVSRLTEKEMLPYLIVAAKNCSLDIIAQRKNSAPRLMNCCNFTQKTVRLIQTIQMSHQQPHTYHQCRQYTDASSILNT